MPSVDLVLAHATLPDGRRVDVSVGDGVIVAIGEPDPAVTAERIDLDGALLGPAFVDAHIHFDKPLLGVGWRPHRASGSLDDRIAFEQEVLRDADAERDRLARAHALVEQIVGFGTGYARSHVDIDPGAALENLATLVELREQCRGTLEIELVAFPQSGILRAPGTADLLDAALREGADVVGGLDPEGFDGDLAAHLDTVFGLAERHGKPFDIHLHDAGAPGGAELQEIAARTRAHGMEGRVAVSHAFELATVADRSVFGATVDALAAAGVAIVTSAPGGSLMPPVHALREAGVRVVAGSDNIRDAWSPYGNGDMLERATLAGYLQDLVTDDELRIAYDMATQDAAAVLGIAPYGVEPGAPANLVAIRAGSVAEAVAAHPERILTLHRGRIVSGSRQP
jgi:cytosine deaminase